MFFSKLASRAYRTWLSGNKSNIKKKSGNSKITIKTLRDYYQISDVFNCSDLSELLFVVSLVGGRS